MSANETQIQNALIAIVNGLKHAMRNSMCEHRITLSPLYFIILKYIDENTPCTAITLAQKLERDKGQITRLVKELESQGLIFREPNINDKRSYFIALTEQGRQSYQTLAQDDFRALQAMTSGLTDEQLSTFISVANTMTENLKTHNDSV